MRKHDRLSTLRNELSSPRSTILYVAVLYSFAPLIFDLTAKDSNPFYYNAVVRGVQAILMLAWLAYMYRPVSEAVNTSSDDLNGPQPPRGIFGTSTTISDYISSPLDIIRMRGQNGDPQLPRTLVHWIKTPFVWVVVANFTYLFFVWSTTIVSAAVSSTVYELYPIAMIALFGYFARVDKDEQAADDNRLTRERIFYIAISPIGLAIVILGQTDGARDSIGDYLSDGLFGIILALIAAILGALSPVASIRFGRRLYFLKRIETDHAVERTESSNHRVALDAASNANRQMLWLSVLGFFIASVLGTMFSLIVGIAFRTTTAFSVPEVLLGGSISGVLIFGVCGILERKANLESTDSTINSGYYLTPVLALVWLAIRGIDIPRFDLFLIGAALIIALTTLIQANPDAGREFTRHLSDIFKDAKERRSPSHSASGLRMGFGAFILSLWFAGSCILLRDEVFLQDSILWEGPEYWTLLTLSSTVFALICGFRVARLTSRTSREEEQARAGTKAMTETQALYTDWWAEFLPALHDAHPGWSSAHTPSYANWMNFPSGKGGVRYGLSFAYPTGASNYTLRAEVYVDDGASMFSLLEAQRSKIEGECSHELRWEPLEDARASRVAVYLDPTNPADRSKWPEYRAWAIKTLGELRRAFSVPIKNLP